MPKRQPKPWDQLKDENAVQYRRFLTYLKLGPSRTIEKAYEELKKELADAPDSPEINCLSTAWKQASRNYLWSDRCAAFDRHHIKSYAGRLGPIMVHNLMQIAEKLAKAIEMYNIGDREWTQVLATCDQLTRALSPYKGDLSNKTEPTNTVIEDESIDDVNETPRVGEAIAIADSSARTLTVEDVM